MKLDIHYLFTAKYAKWFIGSLIGLFSLLILIDYASYFFYPVVDLSLASNKNTVTKPKQDFAEYILHSTLFGVYVPNGLNESSVQKSMLNVTIVGIMFSADEEHSQVIIRSAGGEEKTYKLGDSIPGGVIIKRITASGVLVEHDGNLESLSLPKNELLFEPVAKPLKEEQIP